jgi:hypothetical protein
MTKAITTALSSGFAMVVVALIGSHLHEILITLAGLVVGVVGVVIALAIVGSLKRTRRQIDSFKRADQPVHV